MALPETLVPDEIAAELAVASPEVPSYAPVSEPVGSLFEDYDPVGSLGGMFAPAWIKGFQKSEDAVNAWRDKNRSLTWSDIEDTRMPATPGATGTLGSTSSYGNPMPASIGFGKGTVDPMALTAMAQGGKYDINARRKQIAMQMLQNMKGL